MWPGINLVNVNTAVGAWMRKSPQFTRTSSNITGGVTKTGVTIVSNRFALKYWFSMRRRLETICKSQPPHKTKHKRTKKKDWFMFFWNIVLFPCLPTRYWVIDTHLFHLRRWSAALLASLCSPGFSNWYSQKIFHPRYLVPIFKEFHHLGLPVHLDPLDQGEGLHDLLHLHLDVRLLHHDWLQLSMKRRLGRRILITCSAIWSSFSSIVKYSLSSLPKTSFLLLTRVPLDGLNRTGL